MHELLNMLRDWLAEPVIYGKWGAVLRGMTFALAIIALYQRAPKYLLGRVLYRIALSIVALLYLVQIVSYLYGHLPSPITLAGAMMLVSYNVLLAFMCVSEKPLPWNR